MQRTMSAHLVRLVGDDRMEIKVHGGEKYVVDLIPGVKRSTPLVVVKEPDGSEVRLVMTLAAYRETTQCHGPASCEPREPSYYDGPADDFGPEPWVCSRPVW